jgi:hypothetical protein
MQSIELQNIQPRIQSYIKDENPAEKIAGFFYYSSGAFLWTAGVLCSVTFLLGFLFSPGGAVMLLFAVLIFGIPFWIWAAVGTALFRCHKSRYESNIEKDGAVLMWLSTIAYNGFQAFIIFVFFRNLLVGNAVAGWNLIVVSLSVFALYFELKED